MSNIMRSEFLIDVLETTPAGGAVVEVWWDWVRIEGESSTLAEPFVFDSREADQATGLIEKTFGPLTQMVREKVRLEIDAQCNVSLVEPSEAVENTDDPPAFQDLASKAFGKEAVRYLMHSLVVWSHPGEIEPGDSWPVTLPSGKPATCTFQEIKEIDGEQVAILRTTLTPQQSAPPTEVGAAGERVTVQSQEESSIHAVSLDRYQLVREESKMRMKTKIESPQMVITSEQSMASVMSLISTGSIHDESEFDLNRHAQGQ
jgi:hypothetical protein